MGLRIFKMNATSGFLTALECAKFVFLPGLRPEHHWGNLRRAPDSLAALRGRPSKGGGRGEKGRKREERPPFRKFLDPPLIGMFLSTVYSIFHAEMRVESTI